MDYQETKAAGDCTALRKKHFEDVASRRVGAPPMTCGRGLRCVNQSYIRFLPQSQRERVELGDPHYSLCISISAIYTFISDLELIGLLGLPSTTTGNWQDLTKEMAVGIQIQPAFVVAYNLTQIHNK